MKFERKKVPADPRKLGFYVGCRVSSNGSKPKATRMTDENLKSNKQANQLSKRQFALGRRPHR